MTFLRRLSIRTKLIIASIIPLAALLYYLQIDIRTELVSRQAAQQVILDAAEIQEISKTVHELQKERALTLAYLSGNADKIRDQLYEQRENSDQAITSLERFLKKQGRTIKNDFFIDSLSSVRGQVNALKSPTDIDPFYYGFKARLLDEISTILRSSKIVSLKNQFEEHLTLLYTKDFLAQIRTELGASISGGKFERNAYGSFVALKGKHEFNLEKFKKIASPELKDLFNKKYQGSFVQQTYAIIDTAYRNPTLPSASHDFNTWWGAASSSINALKEIEDRSIDLINQQAQDELSVATANVRENLIIAIFVILLIVFIKASTIREIVRSITTIRQAADKMARGDVDIALDIQSRDEIGELARSFNQMISVSKDFSEIANAIGKGDYSPEVNVRSDKDTLAIALDNMKHNLRKLSNENEIRTWLLTGNRELNDRMRGEKNTKELASEIINQLSQSLKAQIGAIYLKENGSLKLTGSYAFHHRKNNLNSYKPGEGLVGQAALEKKPIVFSEIPEDYIRISSGLGHSIPRNIIVFPFLYEDEVKGVIEIGAAHAFSELDLQFLTTVGENIGIAMNAAESRTKLKELLEETQRQAEELEAQQEELRQSNEELTEKTGLLEKSESELRVQQEELQQTNEELEEKANLLEEQKEKLEQAKMDIENKARELEVTSRYKSEFLANMSHELRTPLNSVLILAQLLTENKSKSLGEKEVEFAKNIYKSGNDLLMLINEILDLSKVESGKMELDIEPVSFDELKADMNSLFGELTKSKGIAFTIEVNESLANEKLITDKQRLEQILRNLLSNAFKFTSGGGRVTLSADRASSSVRFKNRNLLGVPNIIAFSVADTGIGIPEEKQAIVFEAFQQADGSTKRKYGGTGLGLSISRELANALGGEIHLHSEEGKGSEFVLYIPLQFDPSVINPIERTVHVKEPPVSLPSNNNIPLVGSLPETNGKDDRYNIQANDKVALIMEDDPEFAQLLLTFVKERNYKGIIAHEGNTGLSYARHYKPDAIMLDMKMPVMEGTQVLKHLKNDPELRHIPVQVISGYDRKREGLELGAFDFLKKPVMKDDLQKAFDKIENFVNKKLKKLLIVEDNREQNKAICELISHDDVKCVSAYSGMEAYDYLSKESFECIIVDLGLPDMTGFSFMEKIRTNDQLKNIPVIVYTGRDLSNEERNRLNKLADTVVLKTVNSHERLLDETTLFLHRVESKLPREKQKIIRQLHKTDEVLKNRKILVVDDDIRNIYSLTNILEEEGMQCITAENGKAALKALKENPQVDMVLMDVMMPEMDGFETTKEIRSVGKFSQLPIIALTAKAMKGDREKCLQSGMSDYIAKPVNVEQLLSLMRVWLYQ